MNSSPPANAYSPGATFAAAAGSCMRDAVDRPEAVADDAPTSAEQEPVEPPHDVADADRLGVATRRAGRALWFDGFDRHQSLAWLVDDRRLACGSTARTPSAPPAPPRCRRGRRSRSARRRRSSARRSARSRTTTTGQVLWRRVAGELHDLLGLPVLPAIDDREVRRRRPRCRSSSASRRRGLSRRSQRGRGRRRSAAATRRRAAQDAQRARRSSRQLDVVGDVRRDELAAVRDHRVHAAICIGVTSTWPCPIAICTE